LEGAVVSEGFVEGSVPEEGGGGEEAEPDDGEPEHVEFVFELAAFGDVVGGSSSS